MIRFLLQAALILVVLIASWRIGGKPERYVSSIYFAMLLASTANAFFGASGGDADYVRLHGFRFLLDLAALAGVLWVALRFDRWWAIWVGSAQFIAVMAHCLRLLELPMPPIAYAVMERWPVWIAVVVTGTGTVLHYRRSKGRPCETWQPS